MRDTGTPFGSLVYATVSVQVADFEKTSDNDAGHVRTYLLQVRSLFRKSGLLNARTNPGVR